MAKQVPIIPRCETCKAFDPQPHDDYGRCKIDPPFIIIIDGEAVSQRPGTTADDWCLKHVPRFTT